MFEASLNHRAKSCHKTVQKILTASLNEQQWTFLYLVLQGHKYANSMGGAGSWGKLASCKFSGALTIRDFHTGYFRRWRWASRIFCHHTDDVVIFIQLHLCSVLRIEYLRKRLCLLIWWARYIVGKYLSISFTNGQRLRQTEEQILSLELAKR